MFKVGDVRFCAIALIAGKMLAFRLLFMFFSLLLSFD